MQACSPNLVADADCFVLIAEARKGFPPTAIAETTTSAGFAFLTQASSPWAPYSRMVSVFWRIRSRPQPLI